MPSTKQEPKPCPLCHWPHIRAFQVGWATVKCSRCFLTLSRPLSLNEVIAIWNDRKPAAVTFAGPDKPLEAEHAQ